MSGPGQTVTGEVPLLERISESLTQLVQLERERNQLAKESFEWQKVQAAKAEEASSRVLGMFGRPGSRDRFGEEAPPPPSPPADVPPRRAEDGPRRPRHPRT